MKNKSIKAFTAVAGIALVAFTTSCNKLKDFGTTNYNPAAITTPIPSALLTNVEWQLGGFATNARASVTVQYFSEAEYPSFGQYAIPQVDFAATYSSVLFDLQTVIKESSDPAQVAAARILKAYIFWTITDRWGPIPYAEALQLKVPAYSKEEAIYTDMIKELTEAVAQMPAAGTMVGDIMYGGTDGNAQWRKLGNSLRMLMALRLSKRFPAAGAYAATQFNAALTSAAGSISTNADNFKLVYVGGGADNAYSNPFWYTNQQARDNGLSQPLFNMLSAVSDPRAAVYGSSAVAVPYGYSEGLINTWRQANPGWARVFAPAYREMTDPIFIVTAAQVLLARAEAADRGWTADNAATVYAAGITASFDQWGLAAPSASYLANTNVALTFPTGTGANIKNIATQYYFASFPDGTQGWSNWRRTGFPVLTPSAFPVSSAHTTIPRRFTYGAAEYSTNRNNVQTASTWLIPGAGGVGGDVQESRVWWDN